MMPTGGSSDADVGESGYVDLGRVESDDWVCGGCPEWERHNNEIRGYQNRLRNMLKKWDLDECGLPPLTILYWVDKKLPSQEDYRRYQVFREIGHDCE